MLFTSYEFIGFLILLFVLYYLVPKNWQWKLLLAASYVFYFAADPKYLIFILITTFSVYFVSIKLETINMATDAYIVEHKGSISKEEKKAYKAKAKAKKWNWLLFCLSFNIGILSVTKYTNFVITNLAQLFDGAGVLQPIDMIVPMGISFYTFQSMGYIIDVYRGKQEAQKDFGKFALFVSFFPQLVQGPISRYADMSKTLFSEHTFRTKEVAYGFMRILWDTLRKWFLQIVYFQLLPHWYSRQIHMLEPMYLLQCCSMLLNCIVILQVVLILP